MKIFDKILSDTYLNIFYFSIFLTLFSIIALNFSIKILGIIVWSFSIILVVLMIIAIVFNESKIFLKEKYRVKKFHNKEYKLIDYLDRHWFNQKTILAFILILIYLIILIYCILQVI